MMRHCVVCCGESENLNLFLTTGIAPHKRNKKCVEKYKNYCDLEGKSPNTEQKRGAKDQAIRCIHYIGGRIFKGY